MKGKRSGCRLQPDRNNSMKYDVVLFDLDGTLTDPGLGITNSVMYALREFGIPVGARESYYRYIGPPLIESFERYEGVSHEDALELVRLYRVYFADTGIFENEVYDGIPALLADLKRCGVTLSLATSKPDIFSLRILEHFNLRQYFDYAACSTMDETRTNKAEVVAYALELMGKKASALKALMVGDRKHDIIGAKANGVEAAGVTYGYGSREELLSAGADWIVPSVEDLRELLLS